MSYFMTPPKHVNFRAKKLFGEMGHIVDGSSLHRPQRRWPDGVAHPRA